MINLMLRALFATFRSRQSLLLENTAFGHQIEVLNRSSGRPRLRWRDRAFWDLLTCIWPEWRRSLYSVQPETVIRWHREGFRDYWRWKSRPRRPGRPRVTSEVRDLIRQMSSTNLTWGAPRIHGELLKLGIDIHHSAISTYMVRPPRPLSQTWRNFLANHAKDIASIDLFTVPSVTFRVLYVFLVLDNARRRIIHFNVTESPSAAWTGHPIVEAFPWNTAPRYLLRDRDGKYGEDFERRVTALNIQQVLTSPHSPWQNPYAERVIGSIRRECLDHVIILNERHLRRVLNEYFDYYHGDRTHLGLAKDCPEPREVEPPDRGEIRRRPTLGGLHHRYFRDAAQGLSDWRVDSASGVSACPEPASDSEEPDFVGLRHSFRLLPTFSTTGLPASDPQNTRRMGYSEGSGNRASMSRLPRASPADRETWNQQQDERYHGLLRCSFALTGKAHHEIPSRHGPVAELAVVRPSGPCCRTSPGIGRYQPNPTR